MENVTAGIRRILDQCLGVKPAETLLVLTDDGLLSLGERFFRESLAMGLNGSMLAMKTLPADGLEPPKYIAKALKSADAAVLLTSYSMSHTKARINASISGTRIVTMPRINEEILAGPILVDYEEMARGIRAAAKRIDASDTVRLTTEAGTDLTFSIKGREVLMHTGFYHEPGAYGNLPAGETFVPPVEGTANGVLVVDAAMAGIGLLKAPLTLTVAEGFVTMIRGGEEAEKLGEILQKAGKNANNIAEFGVGMNPKAKLSGHPLQDEKILGTVHIALGHNLSFGGYVKAKRHLDGILTAPTVYLDGVKWMDGGRMLQC